MQDNSTPQRVTVNGRAYALPQRPVAVICLDGCDPDHLAGGLAAGELPGFARIAQEGFAGEALSALPSFTNPNNCSLVTGAPPSVHGVSGNFYLDRRTGETVMVTGDKELRAPTILAGMAQAGVPTAVVTAKDKLRDALVSAGVNPLFFADECRECVCRCSR
jgi:phosphonoacetate hydrolase